MNNWLFLGTTAALCALLITGGWRYLPGERWQFLAVVPRLRDASGSWLGVNFTFYGVLIASATVIGILFILILTGSVGLSPTPVIVVLILAVMLCVPASRLIARLVERKNHTFTIGGSFFCGMAAIPLIILLVNSCCALLHRPGVPMQLMLAALAIGYILGEGLGRLACISYGCCYGKPLHQCGSRTALLFKRTAFVFSATTKKAVYEGDLAGVKLVPVQGITSALYTATALVSSFLYLHGSYRAAFLVSLFISQLWRVFSETLRADFRGFSSISAYQKMSVATIVYGSGLCFLLQVPVLPPADITRGLTLVFRPQLILELQLLWIVLFFFFGRSMVTGSELSFAVHRDRI